MSVELNNITTVIGFLRVRSGLAIEPRLKGDYRQFIDFWKSIILIL